MEGRSRGQELPPTGPGAQPRSHCCPGALASPFLFQRLPSLVLAFETAHLSEQMSSEDSGGHFLGFLSLPLLMGGVKPCTARASRVQAEGLSPWLLPAGTFLGSLLPQQSVSPAPVATRHLASTDGSL